MESTSRQIRVGILHPVDPCGTVPGGVESFIRGVLEWAPDDLEYTLFGATTDPIARPVGRLFTVRARRRQMRCLPLVTANESGRRSVVPLIARYLRALRRFRSSDEVSSQHVLDFHRIEPLALFMRDARPKNLVIHHDMVILRSANCDIRWRHAPWLYEALERRLLPHASRVLCVRESAIARYRRAYDCLENRFEFLPTFADTQTFTPLDPCARGEYCRERRSLLGGDPDSALLAWVGRLDRQKRPLLVLEALEESAKQGVRAHLLMIGDGVLRPQVEARIRARGLSRRVVLLGALSASEIAGWLRAADLFVCCSAFEGMPIAVLEALATGVPVVTNDVGEIRRVVQDGVNGIVVPTDTARAFGRAIADALHRLDAFRPACRPAVTPYAPELVLRRVYDNHRAQADSRPMVERE